MAITFSTDIDVLGLHRIVVQGTVDDPSEKVQILQGNTLVGLAHVSANGKWRLTVKPSVSPNTDTFVAVTIDDANNIETVSADFAVIGDIPFAIGSVAQFLISANPAQLNFFSPDGDLFVSTTEQNINNKTVFSETGNGADVPFFCLTADQIEVAGSLRSDIANFHLAKNGHDILDFSNGPFSTIAQVLRHTSTFQGNATIHLDQNSTVKVEGVTKAQLAQHHDVFFFG